MGLLLFTLLFLKLLLCLQLVLQVHSNSSIDTDTITNECTEIVHVASWWELISASFQIVEKYSLLSYLGLLEITPERLKDISELQSLPIEAQIYRKKTNSYSIKHTYSGTSAENRCQSIDSLVSEYGRHPLNKILFYLRTYYVDSSTGLQKYWRCHSDDREGSSNTDYHSTNNTSSNNSNSNSIRNNASLIRSDCYSMITSYEVESQTLKTVKSRTQALLQSPQQEIAGAGADYDENLKFVSALDLSLIFSMAALDAAKTYERSYSRRYAAASEGVSGTLDSEKNDKAYKLIHKDLNKRAVQLAKDRQHFSNSVDSALLLVDIYINDSVIPFINYRLGIAMYEQKLSIHWNKNLPSSSSSDDNDTNLKNTSSSGRLIRILDSVETIFPTDGVPSEAKIVVVEYVISELDVMVPLISNSGQIDGDYIVKRYLYR